MNSRDEISSTEKLLNVIRGEEEEEASSKSASRRNASTQKSSSAKKKQKPSKPKKVRGGGKVVNVGVTFGRERLVLVKASQISEKRWRTMGRKIVPYPVGVNPSSPDFAAFLKSSLSDFCSGSSVQVWAAVPSQSVDIRRIFVPKVGRDELPEAVFWTFKKESPFDDAKVVFDFQVEGEVRDSGVLKIAVIAYTADRGEVNGLRDLFDKAGYPLAGLTAPPFFVQNLFRSGWLRAPDDAVAVLYVGDERTRIDIFSGSNLVLTRGIKAGIHSLSEALVESYNEQWRYSTLHMAEQKEEDFGQEITLELSPESMESVSETTDASSLESAPMQELVIESDSYDLPHELTMESSYQDEQTPEGVVEISPVEGPPPLPDSAVSRSETPAFETQAPAGPSFKESKEPQSLDLELARRVLLWETGESPPLESGDPGYGLSAEEVFDFTLSAADRLVRQLERTLTHFQNNPGSQRVSKILVSGLLSSHAPFKNYIGEQLGIQSEGVDPWAPGLPLSAGDEPPALESERACTAPALSLALSTNEQTPNLLYTHEQREAVERVNSINKMIIGVFLLLFIAAFGVYLIEEKAADSRKAVIAGLNAELSQFGAAKDIGQVLVEASKVSKAYENVVENSMRFQSLAALNELARVSREMQPQRVELLGVTVDFQVVGAGKKSKNSKKDEQEDAVKPGMGLVLEGVVIGQRDVLEATLATFWMHLDNSPLFSEATIHKSEIQEYADDGEVLHFFMKLNVA
ncbi:hypothetical protein [Desulfatibacillum aliphaticivorans]|uniref:hypothetical protein n=1 Tax=Desulfatibacillum aliphaticivorans TaxID=218208 RepID=UPI0004189CE5|nr:hypothetical protein [Desulfatibacillum aliphaticivorans]